MEKIKLGYVDLLKQMKKLPREWLPKVVWFDGEPYYLTDKEKYEEYYINNADYGIYYLSERIDMYDGGGYVIIEDGILTAKEKEYLSAVIKPFKDKTSWIKISKQSDILCKSEEVENVVIQLAYDIGEYSCVKQTDLPWFKKGTYYEGMELGRKYTLEELDL